MSWEAGESEAAVLQRLRDVVEGPELLHEAVEARLHVGSGPLLGVVAAAGFGAPVRLTLSVRETRARLTAVDLTRTSGAAPLSTSLALALWQALDVAHVSRLRVADAGAVAALADERVLARFSALRALNLSHAGLASLPPAIGLLSGLQVGSGLWSGLGGGAGACAAVLPLQQAVPCTLLMHASIPHPSHPHAHTQELRVVGNQLRVLPPAIGQLTRLRVLAADANQLTILPGAVLGRACMQTQGGCCARWDGCIWQLAVARRPQMLSRRRPVAPPRRRAAAV